MYSVYMYMVYVHVHVIATKYTHMYVHMYVMAACTCTYDCFDFRAFQCRQAQVSNLDKSSGPVNENVVTLEVTVDDWWRACVQKVQATQDLPAPAAYYLGLDGLEATHVPVVSECKGTCSTRTCMYMV